MSGAMDIAREGVPEPGQAPRGRYTLWDRFPGPVFRKDMAVTGRRVSTYWLRAIYAALLTGLLGLISTQALNSMNVWSGQEGLANRLQSMQNVAPMIIGGIAWFNMIALAFTGCILGGPLICDEKRAGSMTTLLTTPLKAWQIVGGKMAAVLAQAGILLLVSTPMLLGLRVFGGVPLEAVGVALALLAATVVLSASCAITCSAFVARASGAMASGAVLLVLVQFGPMLAMAVLSGMGVRIPAPAWYATSTEVSLGWWTITLNEGRPDLLGTDAWLVSTGYSLAVSAGLLALTAARVRRAAAVEGVRGAARGAQDQAGATPGTGKAPGPRRRNASRTVGDNPVLWRELHQRTLESPWARAGAVVGVAGTFVWMLAEGFHHERVTSIVLGVITFVLIAAMASFGTVSGISGERESRTLDLLLATPLSARAIVRAKFFGALRKQRWLPACYLAWVAIAILAGTNSPWYFVSAGVILLGVVTAISATGVFYSIACRKTTLAAMLNFGTWLGIWGVIPAFCGIAFGVAMSMMGVGDEILSVGALGHPLPMLITGAEANPDNAVQVFSLGEVSHPVFCFICLLHGGAYMLVAALVLRRGAGLLAERSQRQA